MPAALLMARLSSESRSCLLTEPDFAAAVAKLNDQLHPFTSPMDRFVTLIAAILDPASHTVTLVNAGHTIPFLYRWSERKYTKAVPPEDDGQSLGLEVGARYQSYSMTLSPGDSLVFYSDGVTDAQNSEGKAFRMKGIYNVFETEAPNSPKAMGECLVNSVTNYVKDGVQYDDIALVCFGRPAS
jgi:serine phosphatase RsbU (regulator of sigma subunit)